MPPWTGMLANRLDRLQDRVCCRPVLRGVEIADRHTTKLSRGVAILTARCLVHFQKSQRFQVVGPGSHGILIKQLAVSRLALAQGKFGPLAVTDVASHNTKADRPAVVKPQFRIL